MEAFFVKSLDGSAGLNLRLNPCFSFTKNGFLPALMDAVHEATGTYPNELPLTPDRMVDLLDAREAAQ